MRGKLAAIALLILGPFLAVTGFQEKAKADDLAARGEVVPGVIESGEVRTRKGTKSYTFDVTYTTKAGQPQQQNFSVNKAFANAHVTEDSIVDDAVEVRYLPDAPATAVLVGGEKDPMSSVYGGGAMFAFGGVLAVFVFRRKKLAEATQPTAPAA